MSYSFRPSDFENAHAVPVPNRAPAADRIPVLDRAPVRPRAPAAPAAPALPRPLVLGLTGPAGCGKSTVARALIAEIQDGITGASRGWPFGTGAEIVATGTPMKAALAAIYDAAGLTPAQIARRIDGEGKRRPCVILGGRTPTEAMQTLGTEWGRQMIHPDLWANLWRYRAEAVMAAGRAVLNDSVRFDNERTHIHALGGVVVRLIGRRGDLDATHASEAGVAADFEVWNGGTPQETARAILDALTARQIEAANRDGGGVWSRMMDLISARADRAKW